MNYTDMIMLLQNRGVDLKKLDEGLKDSRQLHREIAERDVVLAYDSKLKRVVRIALSVKILISAEGRQLHEIGRTYAPCVAYPGGKTVTRVKEWSISETRKRRESVPDAAIRGLWEECKLAIRHDHLILFNLPDEIDTHESSVYAGILSSVCIQYVRLELPQMPWKGERTIDDGGVKIHTKWFDLRPNHST